MVTIYNNTDLILKQKHLIGIMIGIRRSAVIEHFDLNYDNAWQLLQDIYINKKIFVKNYIEVLLKMPSILRNNKSGFHLQTCFYHIQTYISLLKILVQPIIHTFIIHLAKKIRFRRTERLKEQNHIKDRQPVNAK